MSPHNQSPISRSVGGWMTTITTTTRRRKETGIIRDTDLPVYWPSGNGTCPWSLHSSLSASLSSSGGFTFCLLFGPAWLFYLWLLWMKDGSVIAILWSETDRRTQKVFSGCNIYGEGVVRFLENVTGGQEDINRVERGNSVLVTDDECEQKVAFDLWKPPRKDWLRAEDFGPKLVFKLNVSYLKILLNFRLLERIKTLIRLRVVDKNGSRNDLWTASCCCYQTTPHRRRNHLMLIPPLTASPSWA